MSLNIKVVHISRSTNLDNVIYLGRGRSNVLYPLLANDYSHKSGTLAANKVDTVVDAVRCYEDDLVAHLLNGSIEHKRQMRLLYDTTVQLAKSGKDIHYACWCKHEPNLGRFDHICHCDVLREIVLTKFRKESKGTK